jgi:hypothetical protein
MKNSSRIQNSSLLIPIYYIYLSISSLIKGIKVYNFNFKKLELMRELFKYAIKLKINSTNKLSHNLLCNEKIFHLFYIDL